MTIFRNFQKFRFTPSIDFINYKLAFWAYTIVAFAHVLAKMSQQNIPFRFSIFATFFFALLLPNFLTLLAVRYVAKSLTNHYGNAIPLTLFMGFSLLIGAARGELVLYIEHKVRIISATKIEISGVFEGWLHEPAQILNGALLGFITGLVVAFYGIFINSALKVQNEIVSSSRRLHLEIDELESGMIKFEKNVKEQLYLEVLQKIDLKKILKSMTENSSSNEVGSLLRGAVVERIRSVSSILIEKPKKKRLSLFSKLNDFVNMNNLYLHPVIITISNIAITFGYNVGIGIQREVKVVFINSLVCMVLLLFIKKFLFKKLVNTVSNAEVIFLISALLSLACEFNGLFLDEPLPIAIRVQRFLFFVVLLRLISFIANMSRVEDFSSGPHAVMAAELREKLEYLENAYSEMQREIAEHLHGYLIFQLNEIASRMKNAALSQDEISELIEQVKSSFSYEKYSIMQANFALDMPSLFRLAKEWEGLIEVTYSGDTERIGLLPQPQRREVWNVVVEMINNAFRHGDASKIAIDFDFREKNFLELVAIDNGSGLTNYPTRGTGSKIFSVASDNNWEIVSLPEGGTKVALRIEFYAKTIADLIPATD